MTDLTRRKASFPADVLKVLDADAERLGLTRDEYVGGLLAAVVPGLLALAVERNIQRRRTGDG